MNTEPGQPDLLRIGCVSFLNAKPLIDGFAAPGCAVRYDVPSRLLDDLERGEVDLALCPVIDYQRSTEPLVVVPAGGIGSRGPTLTVRLFSRVPFEQVTLIAADTDSHTSVALARVVMHQRFGRTVGVADFDARRQDGPLPDTMLLIGDKVVTATPPESDYPHELDLGQAWFEATGLPFVFAVWMAQQSTELCDLPDLLDAHRIANADRIDAIVDTYAAPLGWSRDLALRYLGEKLRYAVGGEELQAIERFWQLAGELGLIDAVRPMRLYAGAAT